MKNLFTLFLAICQLSVLAQVAEWTHKVGGTGFDQINAITTDSNGDVIIVGNFTNTVDFDPSIGVTSYTSIGGYYDGFVAKFNSSGGFLWAKRFGSSTDDFAKGVAVDASNNIYVTGNFSGTISFNEPTNTISYTVSGASDGFLVKLNSAGTTLWANKIGGSFIDELNAVDVNSSGSVFVTGSQNQNSTAAAEKKIIFAKYNADGTNAFYHQLNGTWHGFGNAITIDNNDNVYLAGKFSNNLNFHPTGSVVLAVTGNYDGFVAKYTNDGACVWAKKIGGTFPDVVNAVKVHTNGDVYVSGQFAGTDVDFGNSDVYSPSVGSNIFISKLSSTGTSLWTKQIGRSPLDDNSHALELDNNGNVYFTGEFISELGFVYDVNPDPIAEKNIAIANNIGAFLLKYTASGNYAWVRTIYNVGGSIKPFALSLISSNTMYIGGSFAGTTNFNFDYPSTLNSITSNQFDGYLMKVGPCAITTSTITTSTCASSYTINSQTYTTSGIYTQTLTNYLECDSVITLNLFIIPIITSTLTTYVCSNVGYAVGTPPLVAVYNLPGTYTINFKSYLGCDSVLTLNLFIKPISTSTITTSSCSDLVINAQTYTYTGTYYQTINNYLGCDSIIRINYTSKKSYYFPEVSACTSYTLNAQTYTATGIYYQTLTNYLNCDSIIALDLVITNPSDIDNSVTQSGVTLTSNFVGAGKTHQWVNCDNGNAFISGETGASFTPTINGNYAVIIYYQGCQVTSACINIVNVGINETRNASKITIVPNPATESFVINNVTIGSTILIYSLEGKLVTSLVATENQVNITTNNYNNGVYFVHIKNSDQYITKKLIVTNK